MKLDNTNRFAALYDREARPGEGAEAVWARLEKKGLVQRLNAETAPERLQGILSELPEYFLGAVVELIRGGYAVVYYVPEMNDCAIVTTQKAESLGWGKNA